MAVAFRPVGIPEGPGLTDAALALQLKPYEQLPWWAIELLDLDESHELARSRKLLRFGRPRFNRMWNNLAELLRMAEERVMRQPIEAWRELAYNDTADEKPGKIAALVRDAALRNTRAFVQLCDIRDEDDEQVVLMDFHLAALAAMRRSDRPACILLPYAHGKSWLSSELVPLLDWAEYPSATEGRIYLDEDLAKKWTGRLQQRVEENENLQHLFPWIRKPRRNDPCFKIWSTEGFAIGGNPIKQRSFEPHTIKSSKTGFRFSRTGIDDVVSDKEAATVSIQDGYESYIKAVALSMRKSSRRPRSKYGTAFPGFYLAGTLYDRNDVNYRTFREYKDKGFKTLRRDVFIGGDDTRVIWPDMVPLSKVLEFKDEMGVRAFNMRLRNLVSGREHSMFPEREVDMALRDGKTPDLSGQPLEMFEWCKVPPNTKLMIGFDPGSGNRPTHHGARYPAWVLYGMNDRSRYQAQHPSVLLRDYEVPVNPQQRDLMHHVIQWGRMEGKGFHSQCALLADIARAYNCPIAVEDNGTQKAYADEIAKISPEVRIYCHTTSDNKRDPNQGVDQFEPILHNQRLVIHALNAPQDLVKALREEFINWKGSTEKSSGFTDLIMALWIARHQFNLHVQVSQPVQVTRRPLPAYVNRFTRGR